MKSAIKPTLCTKYLSLKLFCHHSIQPVLKALRHLILELNKVNFHHENRPIESQYQYVLCGLNTELYHNYLNFHKFIHR